MQNCSPGTTQGSQDEILRTVSSQSEIQNMQEGSHQEQEAAKTSEFTPRLAMPSGNRTITHVLQVIFISKKHCVKVK